MNQRFPFAAGALAAAVLCAGVPGLALAQAGAVPWLAQPAAEAAPEAPGPVADHACAASELDVRAGQQGAWHGYATQELRIAKRGAGACTLPGAPALALVAADGTRQAARVDESASALASRSIDLSDDTVAVLLVGAPGSCEAAAGPGRRVSRTIELAPMGGGAIVVDGVHVDTLCGAAAVLHLDAVVDEARHAARASAAGTPGGVALEALVARIEAPPTVRRGGTLRYVVTLTNEGESALALSPCPSYEQSLHVEGRSVDSRWRLNCAGAGGEIAAHSNVSFEVEAAVPADLAGGHVKLSWALRGGPAAGTIADLR
jgi:hypothetical protein